MDPIRYTLSFPAPHTHYIEVRAEIPASAQSSVELMMAVWTPGSYLIREYARHVEAFAASANLITEAGGGLEHAESAVLMTTRWATRTRKAYVGWLELASHELFHVWNGKRLRPLALGPFDYERENHTTSLWVVEGITDYFGDLLVHRAGLSTRDELLASLSERIDAVQNAGRLVQSMSVASFGADSENGPPPTGPSISVTHSPGLGSALPTSVSTIG